MPRVSFYTLGCRLNQADTGHVADDLQRHGYELVPWGEASELLVVNSCAVTGTASQKTRQVLRQARRRFPDAFLVLMGCDATVDLTTWSAGPAVPDLIVPNPRPAPLSELLPAGLPRAATSRRITPGTPADGFVIPGASDYSERTRANLKVQDGCDFFCSYCIVPYTRGPTRSRALDDVLREAEELLARGYRELVLSGVNITTYCHGGVDLAGLLEKLLALGPGFRLRLGSAEPGPVLPRVVDVMASSSQLCRFLHLPLQYGEDGLLRLMRRHYSVAEYEALVMPAMERLPGLCLGADVIVGFPGETAASFATTRAFIERMPFSLLHVFVYSPRQGTDAAKMPGRPRKALAEERSADLIALGEAKARVFAEQQLGKTLEVLIEDEQPQPCGWSDNYLQVTVAEHDAPIAVNTLQKVLITAAGDKRQLTGRAVP
ncbi:MAG TPA: MiaB/RimO family radical SAM methylthiotransferase [Lentisphaeria bacterium]|nr:MiaB/RimO family radical SAM methylthiotransferase [Lentisphaeria bacterium]